MRKVGKNLNKCLGLLDKKDREFETISKELKKLYKNWNEKYVEH